MANTKQAICIYIGILVSICIGKLDLTGEEAAQLIRDEFRYAYESYLTYATENNGTMGYDELRPLWFNGSNWYEFTQLLTPIDSLSTLALMGDQDDLLNQTIELVCNFDWDTVDDYINMFELIIRNVGGLLSAYYFIPEAECLKDLVIDLGERIWNSAFMNQNAFSCQTNDNGDPIAQIPWNYINIASGEVDRNQNSQDMAAYATNLVEFGILSVVSGDIRYYRAAKDIMQQMMDLSSDLNLPGRKFDVLATNWDNLEEVWPDQGSHIDAGIDSYFEYMIKCYALFGDNQCLEWWNISYSAILEHMTHYTDDDINKERLWFKRVMMTTGDDSWDVGHYDLHAHFFSSVMALANDTQNAIKNQEANHFMWNLNTTYIYNGSDENSRYPFQSKVTPFNYDFIQDQVVQEWWDLNPEIMESNYYLYEMTKNPIYFQRALQYLEDIMDSAKCTETDVENEICVGYSALDNVNISNITRKPRCQSFFYAETYKYLYLTFVANTTNGTASIGFDFNEFIFNTEAQPLPKEWGKLLLEMDLNNNSLLPDNYNNCDGDNQKQDATINANEFWILLNIYGASFIILLLTLYLMIQLLFSIKKQYRTAYTSAMFHGSEDNSVQKAKSSYFMLCHSWISALFALFTIISIMFFQTDAFIDWNYNINNNEWNSIKWSFITTISFYFASKLTMYFAFSFSINLTISKSLTISRILVSFIIGILIIIQSVNNDDFMVEQIVSDSNNDIKGIGVDPLTMIRIMIAVIFIVSLVILGISINKIKQNSSSFINIYVSIKSLLLIIISTISLWIFMLIWSIDGDNIFVLPCIDLVIGLFCLLLLSDFHSKIYTNCCGKCHIMCTKCFNVYQKNDEKKLKKIGQFGIKANLRSDSTQLAPLEQTNNNNTYDTSQQ